MDVARCAGVSPFPQAVPCRQLWALQKSLRDWNGQPEDPRKRTESQNLSLHGMLLHLLAWDGWGGQFCRELPFSIGGLAAFPPWYPLVAPNPKNVIFIWRICWSCHSLSLMKVWENIVSWAENQQWCEFLTQPPSGTQHITEIPFLSFFPYSSMSTMGSCSVKTPEQLMKNSPGSPNIPAGSGCGKEPEASSP